MNLIVKHYISMDCSCIHHNSMALYGRSGKRRAAENSVCRWIQKRQRSDIVYPNDILKSYVTRSLPQIFRAKEFNMGTIDKIFASHWLDERNVVYGTKCNKVCLWKTWSIFIFCAPSPMGVCLPWTNMSARCHLKHD